MLRQNWRKNVVLYLLRLIDCQHCLVILEVNLMAREVCIVVLRIYHFNMFSFFYYNNDIITFNDITDGSVNFSTLGDHSSVFCSDSLYFLRCVRVLTVQPQKAQFVRTY